MATNHLWVRETDDVIAAPMPATVGEALLLLKKAKLLSKQDRANNFYLHAHGAEIQLVRKSINCVAYTFAECDFEAEPS